MANFNRDFLVPYLENVCTLHLLKRKISSNYDNALTAMHKNRNELSSKLTLPEEPSLDKTVSCGTLFFLLLGIIGILVFGLSMIIIPELSDMLGTVAFFIVACIVFIIIALVEICSSKASNKSKLESHKETVDELKSQYNKMITTAQRNKNQIEENVVFWKKELDKITEILNQAYNINIIPRHYRDIYTAVYLYDWFSTGMSTDLDHALSMYVLEEIKSKLDIIIEKLDDVLINQNHIIKNQERALEQQKSDNKRLMNKLNALQATEEEKNCYLGMIESNTKACAYFAAANYINKL